MEIQNQQKNKLTNLSEKSSADNALIAYSEKKSILTHFAETLTISEAIYQPSLRKLVKTNGEAPMLIFVTDLLHEFLSFVPNSLNSDEIVNYAEKILAHCSNWSSSDLILCLKRGMDGEYGPVKFKWTWTSDFVEWAKKYDQQKDDYFYKRHQELKNTPQTDIIKLIPAEILAKFKKAPISEDENKIDFNTPVPKDLDVTDLKAVDEWIEKVRNSKK